MHVLAVGISHHTAPVEVREQFACPDRLLPQRLNAFLRAGLASEAVLLSTCNRVELYAATPVAPDLALPPLLEFLRNSRDSAREHPQPDTRAFYALTDPESLEHLFKVASGLDSIVLGETEIFGQLKNAYEIARLAGATGATLNRAFQRAFAVAKQLRSTTLIQRGHTSVGSVAVELAERIFSSLRDCSVMIIGAGDTSEKTARALQSRGARTIFVSNRSFDRASHLAAQLGGRAIRFDHWENEFPTLDIVISSTSAPHYILDRPRLANLLRHRKPRPLLLVDLAVPRDIDPRIEPQENVFLYDIDDLQIIADVYLRQRQDEVDRCIQVIRERTVALAGALAPGPIPGLNWTRHPAGT